MVSGRHGTGNPTIARGPPLGGDTQPDRGDRPVLTGAVENVEAPDTVLEASVLTGRWWEEYNHVRLRRER